MGLKLQYKIPISTYHHNHTKVDDIVFWIEDNTTQGTFTYYIGLSEERGLTFMAEFENELEAMAFKLVWG